MAKRDSNLSKRSGRPPFEVAYRKTDSLRPFDRNARLHPRKQIHQIARSIETFGFTLPVLIDAKDHIIAGHGRVAAVKQLGMDEVPAIRLEHLTDEQIRAYTIADNRLAELAEWDHEILARELKILSETELDFELPVIGFETAEIDLMIESLDAPRDDPAADAVPESLPDLSPVSRLGDLWIMGEHRLLCADATERDSYVRLLGRSRARMVFADPPYNVPIDGHVSGLGAVRHDAFVMGAGEMSEAEFTGFLGSVFGHLTAFSTDGSIHFVCMDWRHMGELLAAARGNYAELKNVCVWCKTNAGMGSLYRSQHELVFVFKNGTAAHINNVELGRYGRNRTNVWPYPGVNTLRPGRLDELAMHPTVKPVALVADAIKDCSKRRGIILDPFAGSGTTIIAAEKTGRRARVLELDPRYVDTTLRRWWNYAGEDAVHAETGLSFMEFTDRCTREATEIPPRKPEVNQTGKGSHGG